MVKASWESDLFGECQMKGKVVLRNHVQKAKIHDIGS
jgi:hypothetical protein